MKAVLLGSCVLIFAAGGAALFRLRGSGSFWQATGRGATTARWLWAGYLALCAWLVDDGTEHDWSAGVYLSLLEPEPWAWSRPMPVLVLALATALWLGCVAGWWRSLGVRSAWEVAKHSARGVLWTGPAAMVLVLSGLGSPWPLLLAGALCGPIYLAARLVWPWYAVPAGEWAFGGAVSAALLFGVAFA